MKIPSNPAPDNRIDIIAGCGRVSPTGGLSDKLRIGTSKITDSTWPYPGVGTSYQHVVGGNNPARPCKGDSGGPLFFVNSDGYWAVHGTIHGGPSGSTNVCHSPASSVKLAVPEYRVWILSQ